MGSNELLDGERSGGGGGGFSFQDCVDSYMSQEAGKKDAKALTIKLPPSLPRIHPLALPTVCLG